VRDVRTDKHIVHSTGNAIAAAAALVRMRFLDQGLVRSVCMDVVSSVTLASRWSAVRCNY